MTIFDVLQFFGGVAMLLFGMRLMSDMLEKKAGGVLSGLLSKFTNNKLRGFAFGALLTLTAACTVLVLRAGEKRERKNSRKIVTKS